MSPALAAAQSRHFKKMPASLERHSYWPSSANQKPKHAKSWPGLFRDFMSAMAPAVTSAMTQPHCRDAKGSPCFVPRRARCFSPEGKKITPQWPWHHLDHGLSSGTFASRTEAIALKKSDGKAF